MITTRKIIFSCIVLALTTEVAFAVCPANQLPNPFDPTCDNGRDSITSIFPIVLNFIFDISIPLTTIMVLIAGFRILTSAGDPERVAQGKRGLFYAAIGFAIVLISGGAGALIKNVLAN